MSSGKELRKMEGHTDWITSVAFLSDSLSILFEDFQGKVLCWDANTGMSIPTDSFVPPSGSSIHQECSKQGVVVLSDSSVGLTLDFENRKLKKQDQFVGGPKDYDFVMWKV